MLPAFLRRKKPAPKGEKKPAPPTQLEVALQHIAENVSEASQRLARVNERLRAREKASGT